MRCAFGYSIVLRDRLVPLMTSFQAIRRFRERDESDNDKKSVPSIAHSQFASPYSEDIADVPPESLAQKTV